jgi:hypothetical protein
MLKLHARKLTRRLLMLIVLVAAVVSLSYNPAERRALAVVPCEQCETNYNNCVISCGDPASGACLTFCQRQYNRCISTCE